MCPESGAHLTEPAANRLDGGMDARSTVKANGDGAELARVVGNIWSITRKSAAELLYSYSTLVFMRSLLVGAVLLFCSFLNVNLGAAGILTWLAAIIFGGFIGIEKEDPVRTIFEYNALIVGFSIGFLFRFSVLTFMLIAAGAVMTVLVSCTLYSLLTKYLKLPVLNLPFLVCSTIIYLASVRYSSLFVESFYIHDRLNLEAIPASIQGLLRSLGILIFMPYDLCGILILVGLLLFSRIAFFTAVLSYYLGTTSVSLLTGNLSGAYNNVYSFNFILTGIAVGAVFLVPSRRSYLLALVGVFLSVFVLDAASVVWTNFGVPVFTLPFNMVVLLLVYVLMQTKYPEITLSIKACPEASLSNYLNFARRFDRVVPRPFLPFSGWWTVYQAFEGKWTHKGIWKHAYDFVIEDEEGRTHRNQGDLPEDYYCYDKPVLAPVTGTVVDASDCLRDNAIGEVDKSSNWGNHIIIWSRFGYYVEISHLKYRSLKVKAGDSVRAGEVIAACGNSGHSAQPHVHMQVQYSPELGSETVPFHFSNCLDGKGLLLKRQNLETGMRVGPFSLSRKISKKLNFILDDVMVFKSFQDEKDQGEIWIYVKMAKDGSRYLNVNGTEDRVYFGVEDNCFVFYSFEGGRESPLRFLFAALPLVPLCSEAEVNWVEPLPDNIFGRKDRLYGFLKSFHHDFEKATGMYRFASGDEIHGEISNGKNSATTRVVLDEVKGFKEVVLEISGRSFSLKRTG